MPGGRKVRCLMLDVDGVLVHGCPEGNRGWSMRLQEDLGLSPEELEQGLFVRDWPEIVVGRMGLRPALERFLSEVGSSISAEALLHYWFAQDSRIDLAVLDDCRAARAGGLAVYLATNQEHLRAAYLMQDMGLGTEVDGIFHSAQLGARKPSPEFYAKAARLSGLPAPELLLVDDTAANVDAARAAGWQAVHWDAKETLAEILRRCGAVC